MRHLPLSLALAVASLLSLPTVSLADTCPDTDLGCGLFTLPPWSDGAGWTDPSRYKTILTADLDGDGQDELLGRTPEGLEIWRLQLDTGACAGPGTGCGRWERVTTNTDFSDANGFGDALTASTIHAARLYGKPGAQVFAWSKDGVKVWEYDAGAKTLFLRDVISAFKSIGPDPHQARYLETLQTAAWLASDGSVVKGSLNLAMRDVNNQGTIQVVGYCGTTGWCSDVQIDGFEDSTRFGTQPYAWRTIHFGDIDNDGREDVYGSDGVEFVWIKNDGATGIPQDLYMLPSTTDWGQPSHYLPMISGIFEKGRGAGGVQIMLRGSDTVRILCWFSTIGRLVDTLHPQVATGPQQLTDPALDPTEYSGTWQAVDVTGDGQTELILRTPGGVRVYEFVLFSDPTVFREITAPAFTDSARWGGDSRARTIRIAKSGSAFLLVGRSGIGIETGRLVPGTFANPGHFEKISAAYPQFTGAKQTAYVSISSQLGVGEAGVRSVYSTTQANITTYLALLPNVRNNGGVEPNIFQEVFNQIQRELTMASFTAALFDYNEKLIDESFLGASLTATAVAQRLSIDDAQAHAVSVKESQFLQNLLKDSLQSIQVGGFKYANLFGAIAGTIIGLLPANQDQEQIKIADFDARLSALFQQAVANNGLAHAGVAADYGLMAEVGAMVQSGEFPIDDTARVRSLAATQYAFELGLWKTITPAAWKIFVCGEHSGARDWPQVDCDGAHEGAVTFSNRLRSWPVVDVTAVFFNVTDPNPALVDKIFRATAPSCQTVWSLETCGFGLDAASVYRGEDGWTISCITLDGDLVDGFTRKTYDAPCDDWPPTGTRGNRFQPPRPKPAAPRVPPRR